MALFNVFCKHSKFTLWPVCSAKGDVKPAKSTFLDAAQLGLSFRFCPGVTVLLQKSARILFVGIPCLFFSNWVCKSLRFSFPSFQTIIYMFSVVDLGRQAWKPFVQTLFFKCVNAKILSTECYSPGWFWSHLLPKASKFTSCPSHVAWKTLEALRNEITRAKQHALML